MFDVKTRLVYSLKKNHDRIFSFYNILRVSLQIVHSTMTEIIAKNQNSFLLLEKANSVNF